MKDAIFESTSQALHVSFMVGALEVRQETALRRALIQILQDLDKLTTKQKDWLDQLIGAASGTVNFGGLSPSEIRAQCAMVTQVVRDHLPAPEMHAVLGKYSYQVDRANAVKGLAEYIQPQLTIGELTAIHALLYGHFAPHLRTRGLSIKEINEQFNIHVHTLRRAAKTIAGTVRTLETMAIERLTPMFARDGLVECPESMEVL